MAIPALIGSSTFDAAFASQSGVATISATANRRLITCSVPSDVVGGISRQAGWIWAEVRNELNQFVRVDTSVLLTGAETGLMLPDEYTALAWRLSFIPVQGLTPRTGTFRFYTI